MVDVSQDNEGSGRVQTSKVGTELEMGAIALARCDHAVQLVAKGGNREIKERKRIKKYNKKRK